MNEMDNPKYNPDYSAAKANVKGMEGLFVYVASSAVGFGAIWLATKTGISIDPATQTTISLAVGGVLTGVYFRVTNWAKNAFIKK